MRYVLTVVEQLDRAARELNTDHPINNRLSLILVDNATELILHRKCTDHLDYDHILQKLQPKQRLMARGHSLEGKLKVLEYLDDLESGERQFIRIAHQYRNELYHVGLKHDDIIRAISGHYFLLCIDLFVRLKPSWQTISSDTIYTDVSKRYVSTKNGRIASLSVEHEVIAEKLRDELPNGIPDLAETLADSARRSIEEITDSFKFIVENAPSNLGADALLATSQKHFDLTKALDSKGISGMWGDPNYRNNVTPVESEMEATWKQRHPTIPTEGWMLRANNVERADNPLIAMYLYQALRNDMVYLEEAILTFAGELDREIQLEIDRRRGK